MRHRILLYAMLISLVTHAVIGWNALHQLHAASKRLSNQTYREMIDRTGHNLVTYFQDLEALASLLRTSNITDYARLYLNMHGDAAVRQEGEKVNEFLNQLSLQRDWVEKIYLLGRNNNQANFSKTIGESGWNSADLPSVDDLRAFGMLDVLLQRDGIPTYHFRKTLLGVLEHAEKAVLDIPQLVRNLHLLNEIEDRPTITVYERDVVVLIVLPKHFMNLFLSDGLSRSGAEMRLTDTDRSLIWTSGPDSGDAKMPFMQVQQLSPYQLQLELYHDDIDASWQRTDMGLIAILLLSSLVSFVVAYVFSRRIFLPIRQIAQAIKHDTRKMFPKRTLPLRRTSRFAQNMSLQRKMFYYFVCSVMVPVIVTGLFFSYASYQINKQQLIDSRELMTEQLGMNVRLNKISFLNLSHQLMLQETELLSEAASVHPKMSDVSYYVLYDSKGSTRFSSIYGNNLELFPINPSILTTSAAPYTWMPLAEDVFNHSTSSLVSKLVAGGRTEGYLDLKIKPQGLVAEDSRSASELLLLDEAGRVLYQSDPDLEAFRAAEAVGKPHQDRSLIHIGGEEYIRIARPMPESGWLLLHFVPLKEIVTDSQLQLMRHIYFPLTILLLAFLLSYAMSRSLVKPLLQLHRNMSLAGEGEFQPYERKQKDEIKELADNYNRMISEINHLLDEQIKSRVREQEISSLKMKAELGMLQQQINPHFLYNTLESVKFRAMQNDVEGINRIVLALAAMLRYSVRGGSQEVPLSEELDQIKHYYTIQKIRLRDKLELEWDIQDEALDSKALKFILQPLVENAIEHGVLQVQTGGTVRVAARLESTYLAIEVSDNGVGMNSEELETLRASLTKEEATERGSGGVGLKNVYQRLQLFYRGAASLEIHSSVMTGTRVLIKIPLKQ